MVGIKNAIQFSSFLISLFQSFLTSLSLTFFKRFFFFWCGPFLETTEFETILLLFFSFFLIVVDFVIHWNESAMGLHVFPSLIPPPTSLSTRSLWVFPVHQPWALVSCIQPGMVICFILDNIHVPMLFSWNIPPSPSPTESKRLFYTSVSLFLFCI